MAGADRLGGVTGTPVVSQRSETGQGILVVKSGRGKYDVLYDVVCKTVNVTHVGRLILGRTL